MNIHNVYLISQSVLKKKSLITDPVLEVYIKPAIECAQKIGLRSVIGDCLLEKLQVLVSTVDDQQGKRLIDLPQYAQYKNLLIEHITDYLAYATMSYIVMNAREKFRNAGIVNTYDNTYTQPQFDEITYTKRYYDDLASSYASRLRKHLEDYLNLFPEYRCMCDCGDNGKSKSVWDCGIVI